MEETLNELGEEGWLVFSLEHLPSSTKVRVVARKPLTSTDRRRSDWPNY